MIALSDLVCECEDDREAIYLSKKKRLDIAAFINNGPVVRLNDLGSRPDLATQPPASLRSPGIDKTGLRVQAGYETRLYRDVGFNLAAVFRYYGGANVERELRRPGYVEAGLDARLTKGRYPLALRITNLFDSTSSRFAPGIEERSTQHGERQLTPLQPRMVRTRLDVAF